MKTIKLNYILCAVLSFWAFHVKAQEEGLSIGKKSIDESAILEVTAPSNNKGVLLPRLTSFQRESIPAPQEGLLVFDTDQDEFYYFDGNQWLSLNHSKYRKGSNAVDEDHFTIALTNSKNVGITNRLAVGDKTFVKEAVEENSVAVQGEVIAQNNISTEGQFVGYGTVPLGGIIMWSGKEESIPDGYVLCIGQKIADNQSSYHNRYAPNLRGRFIAGYDPDRTDYDDPGGLSDLSARGNSWGKKGGKEKHALTLDEMPRHNHSLTITSDGSHQHIALIDSGPGEGINRTDPGPNDAMWKDDDHGMNYGNPVADGYLPTSYAGAHSHLGSSVGYIGGGINGRTTPHENRPPYYVLAFIMRVK